MRSRASEEANFGSLISNRFARPTTNDSSASEPFSNQDFDLKHPMQEVPPHHDPSSLRVLNSFDSNSFKLATAPTRLLPLRIWLSDSGLRSEVNASHQIGSQDGKGDRYRTKKRLDFDRLVKLASMASLSSNV